MFRFSQQGHDPIIKKTPPTKSTVPSERTLPWGSKKHDKNIIQLSAGKSNKNLKIKKALKEKVEQINKIHKGSEAWQRVEKLHNELLELNSNLEKLKYKYSFYIEIDGGKPAVFQVHRKTYKATKI